MTIMLHKQAKPISTIFDLLSISQEDAIAYVNNEMDE